MALFAFLRVKWLKTGFTFEIIFLVNIPDALIINKSNLINLFVKSFKSMLIENMPLLRMGGGLWNNEQHFCEDSVFWGFFYWVLGYYEEKNMGSKKEKQEMKWYEQQSFW